MWEGNAYTVNDVLTLSDDYTNYDQIIIYEGETSAGNRLNSSTIMNPSKDTKAIVQAVTDNNLDIRYDLVFSAKTVTIVLAVNGMSGIAVRRIEGIKFLPNPNNYSTTEQEIGTWIDGKKLYQVTLSGTTASNTNTTTKYNELPYNDLTPYNIDTVVDITGGCYSTNYSLTPFGRFQLAYVSQFYEDNRSVLNAYTDKDTSDNNKLKLYIVSGSWYAGSDYFVTIKYTKV